MTRSCRLFLVAAAIGVASFSPVTDAFSNMAASRPSTASKPSVSALLQYDSAMQGNVMMEETAAVEKTRKPMGFARNISNMIKIDKAKMAKLGVTFALSYSFISNINGSISLSVAWYLAASKTGLSPLVPGQWKSLLAAYAGLYAIITIMRPLRVAAAATLAGKVDNLLQMTQRRLNCGKSAAIGLTFSAGILIWLLTAATGVSIASAASGVPIFPASM